MMRRAFSNIDRSERRRLLDELRQTVARSDSGAITAPAGHADESAPAFDAALPLLLTILGLDRAPAA